MTVDNAIFDQELSAKNFTMLRSFIEKSCGIKLADTKKSMVEGRLRKRIRALGMSGYKEYLDYVMALENGAAEQLHLIDVITTNKTEFFRENNHFESMTNQILPLLADKGFGSLQQLKLWSCASSTGEEPYTMAMVMAEFFGIRGNFAVYATDINTAVLETGRKAIYTEEKAQSIPFDLKKKYMLRSVERADKLVRFRPEIRSKVKFARNNLKENKYVVPEKIDIAFCRNVIIYFDTPTQEMILNKICSYIRPGGYLFLGHSESVHGMTLPLKTFSPTIYIRT
ncbi:MCP methyltransferase, CheR-type [Denitrovibrio acetiphilus DSM 12809]|uniref:protein-glutamate O-methyltransferase n=1 Tax=Denitrovibrio acetiphilus (strain DSM 12809 / NBRC 114555 / N2460) TaxID=522772 RepID=D4H202_DENA2|nr:CheR family methyltransferase [Denitrovibrio acetiphilus]ADD66979.1 MCP methyltransferase, CheR-type [Denitrovibrio acetiphilus DSM 12809]